MKPRLVSAATVQIHSRIKKSTAVSGEGMENGCPFTKAKAAMRGAKGVDSMDRVALPQDGDVDPAPLESWSQTGIRIDG